MTKKPAVGVIALSSFRFSIITSVAAIGVMGCGSQAENGQADAQAAQPGAVIQDCEFCPEVKVIPAGVFKMGRDGGEPARYEGPIRDVTISTPFALGTYEVTNAQYGKFIEETGYQPATSCYIWDGEWYSRSDEVTWEAPVSSSSADGTFGENDPVTCVNWDDAKAYTAWLSEVTGEIYRLPSEAEWAYAAHGGAAEATYVWGEREEDACAYANIYDEAGENDHTPYPPAPCNDGFYGVSPVGSLAPNGYGLYDMIGNVWEWVEDCYVMTYLPEPADESPQTTHGCDRRGIKGGAWSSRVTRQRPEFRGRDPIDTPSYIFGFRVARQIG